MLLAARQVRIKVSCAPSMCRTKSRWKVLCRKRRKSTCKMSLPDPARNEIAETRPPSGGFLQYRDWIGLAFVSLLPFVVYWRATFGVGMFFFGDIARYFFPTRVLYAQALENGRVPLWQPEILTGV